MDSITLFNVALKSPLVKKDMVIAVNREAVKCGYIVEPHACTSETLEHFKSQQADLNSTFYSKWQDIVSKNRFELLVDQLAHYGSTYGSNFTEKAWVPNVEHDVIPYQDYKLVTAVTPEELTERVLNLLNSGIHLSEEVLDYCTDVIVENLDFDKIDVSAIKNIEAQIMLYDKYDKLPNEKFQLLRYINYKTIGHPVIIQSDENIRRIRSNANAFDFNKLNQYQMVHLSSIFLRYKKFFLAFKASKRNTSIINKLRRLATKYHQPLKRGFWEHILEDQPDLETVRLHLDEVTPFKIFALLEGIYQRLCCSKNVYVIRNGKIFVKEAIQPTYSQYYDMLADLFTSYLRFKYRNIKVKLPKNIRIACPTSEKKFVGNYPCGSYIDLNDNNTMIAIYWRNEWGTRDFDLSFLDQTGRKIGWDARYYSSDQKIIFSGDMTNADPEATEVLLFKDEVNDGVVFCNRFNGNENSRFDFIIAQEEAVNFQRNYMINPNNIQLRVECKSTIREEMVGVVKNNKFYFMNFGTGDNTVSNNYKIIEFLLEKVTVFTYLDDIFTVVEDDYEGDDYIDLTEPNKDSIIGLFA